METSYARAIFVAVVVALTVLFAIVAVSKAEAHHYSAAAANEAWRATNYGGACGAGATFYCATLQTSNCNNTTGEHSRACVGYYKRGPGLFWPTNCKATGVVYHARQDPPPIVNSNVCWD